MAKTAFASSDALTKKIWEEKLYKDTLKESYFSRFMSESENSICQVDNKLTKQKGDRITFGIAMRLTGAGVTSGQTLEGNEEKLVTYSFNVTLEQYRHAVRDQGKMDRQRVTFSIDEVSQERLKGWGAEKIDSLAFTAIQASPTKIFYKTSTGTTATGTAATAKTALTAADGKITPAMVSFIKANAITGAARTYTPLRRVPVEGKNYFVLVTHPDALYDLKQDSSMLQALREAEVRGSQNPIFTGSVLIYDGVVIHEHENVTVGTDAGAGSNVAWCHGVFMGAQSLVWAWGAREEVVAETFDYQNEHGYAWGIIAATGKPVFNSLDYGSVHVYLARTNVSGV